MRTLFAIFELLRLALRHGPRMDNPWWNWRRETAFTSDPTLQPDKTEQRRAILDYGRWVHDMRKFTR